MACKASWGGRVSSHPFQRIKSVATPRPSWVFSCNFCSSSNHGRGSSRRAKASETKAESSKLNKGDFKARASDRSCCGDTSTSSNATTSCTSQHSIKSHLSPTWAAICKCRSSSCNGNKPARLRDNTMTLAAPRSLPWACQSFSCCAIQAAACRASWARRLSSGNSRGVRKLSRQPVFSAGIPSSAGLGGGVGRGVCGSLHTKPTCAESVVCGRNPG